MRGVTKVTKRKAARMGRSLRDYASGLRGSLTARPCADSELAGVLPATLRAFSAPTRRPITGFNVNGESQSQSQSVSLS